MESFTEIAHPFQKLLKKAFPEPFALDCDQTTAFKILIEQMCSPSVVFITCTSLPYSIDFDDTTYGVGYALLPLDVDRNTI